MRWHFEMTVCMSGSFFTIATFTTPSHTHTTHMQEEAWEMQDMANIAQVMKVEAETVESASMSAAAAAAAAAEGGGSKRRSEEGGRSFYWGMIYQVYLDRQVCGPAGLLLQFPPITATVAAAWI